MLPELLCEHLATYGPDREMIMVFVEDGAHVCVDMMAGPVPEALAKRPNCRLGYERRKP